MAVACAFDLMMLNSDDLRRKPFAERKAALRRLLKAERDGIQYVEHREGDGDTMFEAECKLGLEGIVSKRLSAPYGSGPRRVGSPQSASGNPYYRSCYTVKYRQQR